MQYTTASGNCAVQPLSLKHNVWHCSCIGNALSDKQAVRQSQPWHRTCPKMFHAGSACAKQVVGQQLLARLHTFGSCKLRGAGGAAAGRPCSC